MENTTLLMPELSNSNRTVVDGLLPLVYDGLKNPASGYLSREGVGNTLQTTALVQEAYLKLIGQTLVNRQNQTHFFGMAAQMMRRVLIDRAKFYNAEKSRQAFVKLESNEELDEVTELSVHLIRLDDALRELAEIDPQKARLVELRYFGNLSFEEISWILSIPHDTVKRHWRVARAFLYGRLRNNDKDIL